MWRIKRRGTNEGESRCRVIGGNRGGGEGDRIHAWRRQNKMGSMDT